MKSQRTSQSEKPVLNRVFNMALPDGIQSTQELLNAQSHIWNHIFSFINSMSLKCAVQLRVPDIIHNHNKPIKLAELANALSINQAKTSCLGRLMRILVHSKFFSMSKISDEEEGYSLTPASLLLRRDESLATFVLCALDPIIMDPVQRMSEWFRDDKATAFVTTHGRSQWELHAEDPRFNEGLESMVDVGGGTGTMARLIADAFPGLKCTVLDLPQVVRCLEGSENLKFVEGDMFNAIPSAQAVYLKFILHNWSDEECVEILKKCKEAIPSKEKGGKVIIIDIVVGDQKDKFEAMEAQLFFDILMMFTLPGREQTVEDWANIFQLAGFTSYNKFNHLGRRSLIEAFP
ncbi:hypothetical protein ACS0TY_031797 [Phlomoides rotata]